MGDKKGYKRRVYLINPKFQLTCMGYVVGMAAMIIAIFYAANIYFFWKFTQMGRALGLPGDHVFFRFIGDQKYTMNFTFLIVALIAFINYWCDSEIKTKLISERITTKVKTDFCKSSNWFSVSLPVIHLRTSAERRQPVTSRDTCIKLK